MKVLETKPGVTRHKVVGILDGAGSNQRVGDIVVWFCVLICFPFIFQCVAGLPGVNMNDILSQRVVSPVPRTIHQIMILFIGQCDEMAAFDDDVDNMPCKTWVGHNNQNTYNCHQPHT